MGNGIDPSNVVATSFVPNLINAHERGRGGGAMGTSFSRPNRRDSFLILKVKRSRVCLSRDRRFFLPQNSSNNFKY